MLVSVWFWGVRSEFGGGEGKEEEQEGKEIQISQLIFWQLVLQDIYLFLSMCSQRVVSTPGEHRISPEHSNFQSE